MKNANPFSNGQECRISGLLATLIVYFLLFLVPDLVQAQLKSYASNQNSGRRVSTTLLPSYSATTNNTYAVVSNAASTVDGNEASFGTLVAKATEVNLGVTIGYSGEAWVQMLFPSQRSAGSTTYVRIDLPVTEGVGVDLLGLVGDLTGLLTNNVIMPQVWNQAVTGSNNTESGTQISTGISSAIVRDAQNNVYVAVKSESAYNAVSLKIRYPSNLLGIALGASVTLNVYEAFSLENQAACEPMMFSDAGTKTGVSVNLGEVVKNPSFAIDVNTSNYSEISTGTLSLLATASQNIYFSTVSEPNMILRARLQISSSALNANLLGAYHIRTYNGSTLVSDNSLGDALISGIDLLGLFTSGGIITVPIPVSDPFDRVEIGLFNTLGVNLGASDLRIYGLSRSSAACPEPAGAANPLFQPQCANSTIVSSQNTDDVQLAVDGNFDSYATIRSDAGILIGLADRAGHLEVNFPTSVPAGKTAYVRIDYDADVLQSLLAGSIGNLVGGLVNGLVLGNHFFEVQLKNGTDVLLNTSSADLFNNANGQVRIVQDKEGRFYIAITSSVPFNGLRLTDRTAAALGLLAPDKYLNVYSVCFDASNEICDPAFSTSFDGRGISLALLQLGKTGVENPQYAIDDSDATFSQINLGTLSAAGSMSQYIHFNSLSDPNSVFKIKLAIKANQALNVDLLGAYEVVAYNGNAEVYRRSLGGGLLNGTNVLGLLGTGEAGTLTFAPGRAFDRIEIRVNSLLNVSALESAVEVYDVKRFGPSGSACADPDFVLPTPTAGPFEIPACEAQVVDWQYADYPNLAADGNNESFASLTASSGTLLGIGAYSGFLEYEFPTNIPANKTTYVRIDMDGDILDRLLSGTLGTLVSNVGGLLLGNHYFSVEAKTTASGSTPVLTGSSAAGFTDVAGGDLRLVQDNIGRYYIAVTPNVDYRYLRITEHFPSLVGTSQAVASMRIYEACMEIGVDNCLPAQFTSFDQSGLTLGALNGAGVANADHAISVNSSDYSEISTGTVAVAAEVAQRIYFNKLSAAGDTLAVRLQLDPASLASIDLVGRYDIVTYNGSNEVQRFTLQNALINNLNLLDLFASGGIQTLLFETTAPYDRVDVVARSLVNVAVTPAIRLYAVTRIGDGCPTTKTPSPFENPVCVTNLVASSNVNNVAHLFDDDFDSYATLNSGSNALLGQLLGGQPNQYSGFVELGFDAPIAANKTAYMRIDFEPTVLSRLLGGSLGGALATVVDNLLLGNHYFNVEVKRGNATVLAGGSHNNFGDNNGRLRIVQDKVGRYYVAITPTAEYDAVRITDHTNTALPLVAQPNAMNVYGVCVDNPLTDCQPVFTTSFDAAGLNLTAADLAGSGAGVDNPDHAINDNTTDYSEISLGNLAVGQSVRQYFDFRKLSLSSEVVNLRLQYGTGGLNANIIGALEIVAYRGATPVDTLNVQSQLINGLNVLGILNNATGGVIPYAPGVAFDRISVGLKGVLSVGVLPELRVYAVEKDCSVPMFKTWKSYQETSTAQAVPQVTGGEELTYTIHIANTGSVELTNYSIVDKIPAFTTYVSGSGGTLMADSVVFENITLAAGDTATRSFRVLVHTNLTGASMISNVAFVKEDANDPGTGTVPPADLDNPAAGPNESLPPGTTTDVPVSPVSSVVAWKGFAVAGGTSTTTVSGGENITYTIYVTNTGNQDLSNVSISDLIPVGTKALPDNTTTTVTFTGIDISVGDTVSRSFTVQVDGNLTGINEISNVATVDVAGVPTQTAPADPTDPTSGPASGANPGDPTLVPVLLTDEVVAWKGYTIANGVSTTSVAGGEEVTYTIFVQNNANQDLSGLSIKDALPVGSSFLSAADGGIFDTGMVTFSNVSIAYGATAALRFTVKIDSNLSGLDNIANVAFVTVDPADPELGSVPPFDPIDPAAGPDPAATPGTPTLIPVADLHALQLTFVGVSTTGVSGQAQAGTEIRYTVTLKNTGNKNLDNLLVKSGIPAYTTFASSSSFTLVADSVELTHPQLLVGDAVSFVFNVTVDDPLNIASVPTIVNTANASNDEVYEEAIFSMPTTCTTVDASDISIGSIDDVCLGDTISLSATLTGRLAGVNPQIIRWYAAYEASTGAVSGLLGQGGRVDIVSSVAGTQTYYAVVDSLDYCFDNPPAQVQVTVSALPPTPVITTNAGTVCQGEEILLTATSGATSYMWFKDAVQLAETTNTLRIAAAELTDAGDYSVIAVNAASCQSLPAAVVAVVVNRKATQADIAVSGNAAICEGSAVQLSATSTTVFSPVFYWYDSATATTPIFTGAAWTTNPTDTVTYYVAVSGTAVCENDPANRVAVTVNVSPAPRINFNAATTYSIEINQTVPVPSFVQEPGVTYVWKTASGAAFTGSIFGPFATPGTYVYTLIATNAAGCQTSANITIRVFNPGECPPIYTRVYASDASQYAVSNVLGIPLGTITSPERAADQDIASFSELTEGANVLGLFGQTYQNIKWSGSAIPPGTAVTVKVGQQSTLAQVARGLRIQAINAAGAPVGVSQSMRAAIANVVQGLNVFDYTFVPTDESGEPVPYSGVRVYLQALASVAQRVNLYEAYYHTEATVDCANQDEVMDILTGVEYPINGLSVLTGLVSVQNPENAVDGDAATAATLNNAVGVNAFARMELLYHTPALAGDTLIIDVAKPATLLTANLLQAFTIQPYLGNVAVGEPVHNNSALLNISLLGGGTAAEIKFLATSPFDRIKILYGGVATVLDQLEVREIKRVIPTVVAGPNGDNRFEICPGEGIDIPDPDNCTTYLIYDAATGGSLVDVTTLPAVVDTTLYVQTVRFGSCEIGDRTPISLTVNALPTAPVVVNEVLCQTASNEMANYNVTALPNHVLIFYADGSTSTAMTSVPVVNTTVAGTTIVYVSQRLNTAIGCESERVPVSVTITARLAPSLTESAQTFCAIDSATVGDLNTAGATGTVVWYSGATGGTALAPTALLVNGSYYAAQIGDSCESVDRTEVTVTITATLAPSLTESAQTFCAIDSATVGDLNTAGATGTIVWYSSAMGGTALAPTALLVNGSYYAAQIGDGCESVDRTEVTVTITATPAPTIIDSTPVFCSNDNKTLADISVVGMNISWYDAPMGGTMLPASTMLQNGITYYATQRVDNCESVDRLAVTPVVEDCSARLSITKVANDTRVRAGASTSFDLTITNRGPGMVESGDLIRLAELPSAGLTITGYSITSGNATIVGAGNAANITATSTIAVGGTITVRVTATVGADAPATVSNGVRVWGPDTPDTEDPDDEDETPEIPVDRESKLGIRKVADQSRVKAGESTTFTVTITNEGPASIASGKDIRLVELPSFGLTITGYEVTSGSATVSGNATTATVTTSDVLNVGADIVIKITAAVAADAPATISNAVQVWGPDKPETEDPDDEDETPEIPVDRESVLRIEKMADEARVRAGESTSFTVTVTNDGPAVIAVGRTINLRERPGAGVEIQGYSVMGTNATIVGTENSAVLTTTAVIPVGGTIIVKITALVDDDAPETITNGITVWGPDEPETEDPDDEDDTDPIPVDHPRIQAMDDLAETKTAVPVTIAVLENDVVTKWDIDPSTAEIVSFNTGSTVILLGNGEVTYTSSRDFIGEDTFSYRVKDIKGRWSNEATVRVSVAANPLVIPNVITPNGDNLNDRLVILGTESFDRISLTIINRWGNEVYQNDNYKGEWDGRGLNDGTYFVFVRAIKGGNATEVKSTVLIKRN